MNKLLPISLGLALIAAVLMAGCLGPMGGETNVPNMTASGQAAAVIAPAMNRSDCGKNLTDEKIIFFYSPTCPHCIKDYPLVEEKAKTTPIYFAKGTDPACAAIADKYKSEYVPYFVCVLNNKTHTGEFDAQGLDDFVSECK